jgi:hypothetical protein
LRQSSTHTLMDVVLEIKSQAIPGICSTNTCEYTQGQTDSEGSSEVLYRTDFTLLLSIVRYIYLVHRATTLRHRGPSLNFHHYGTRQRAARLST